MKHSLLFILIVSLVSLTGCAAKQLKTTSGKPELTIIAPETQIKNEIYKTMAADGYFLFNENSYELIFRKEINSIAMSFLSSFTYGDTKPEAEVIYQFITNDNGTHLIVTLNCIMQNSRNETIVEDMTKGVDAEKYQERLLTIKKRLEQF